MLSIINRLVREFSLRTLPKKKPVLGRDDLYLLLYMLWGVGLETNKQQNTPKLCETALLTVPEVGVKIATISPLSKPSSARRSGRDLQVPHALPQGKPPAVEQRITSIVHYGRAKTGVLVSIQSFGMVKPRQLRPRQPLFRRSLSI